MKRDMDLVRMILLAYEIYDSIGDAMNDSLKEYSEREINYHQHLMADAGLLVEIAPNLRIGCRMTWFGHDFLEASRDEKRWAKAKEIFKKVGGATFDIMLQILTKMMKDKVDQILH